MIRPKRPNSFAIAEAKRTMPHQPADEPQNYEALVETLSRQINRLPEPVRASVQKDLDALLDMVRDRRPPRFMLLGRRGAGKSTLINAIFGQQVRAVGSVSAQTGQAEWLTYREGSKALEILDTRGVQEASRPQEEDSAKSATDSLHQALHDQCPDVLLFLIKAKELDSALEGDLAALREVHTRIERVHKRQVPILGIITQADELDPPDIRRLPTDDEEKNEHITQAVALLERHFQADARLSGHYVEIIPTAAYVRFRNDGTLDEKRDYRWNIDRLVELLLAELPQAAKLDFARLAEIKQFQRSLAQRVVNGCAVCSAAIATQPLPVADMPILITIQMVMIGLIAYIAGRELDFEAVRDLSSALGINVGGAYIFREMARTLIKFFPGWGSITSGIIASSATEGLGRAAIAYFIDDMSIEEVRQQLAQEQKLQ